MGSSSSKEQTAGYRYYFDIHMGLCRGPIDALKQIRVDDKVAWPISYTTLANALGSYTVTADGVVFTHNSAPWTAGVQPAPPPLTVSTYQNLIEAPNLFGGDDREGGIRGYFDLMMGEPTQPQNPRLVTLLGDLVSSFRGMVTLYYSGLVATMNPYPKAWKFRLQRALAGWDGPVFYPARCVINMNVSYPDVAGGPNVDHPIYAMNPAHIIYEAITNRDWGRGASRDLIDEASFTVAADRLFAEGFGLCLKWSREDTIDSFVQQVMDHIGAVLYLARDTGLFTFKLIRSDYVVANLTTFTTSTGILTVEEDDQSMPSGAVNEIVVSYMDPIEGQPREVRVQNIASMQALGAINSKTTEYIGIPTPDLALRVAQRDLRVHSADVRKFKFTMDRRAFGFVPGTVFKFTDPVRQADEMVLRVVKIEDHADSTMVVYVIEDIFGLAQVSYAGYQPAPAAPNQTPTAATTGTVYEASYRDLYLRLPTVDFQALDGTESFVYTVAAQPSTYAYDYRIYSGYTGGPYSERASVNDWTPLSTLVGAITPLSSTFSLNAVVMPRLPAIGDILLIDNEVVQVTAFNTGTGIVSVYRGCVDTVPAAHAAGARVWFVSIAFGTDDTRYLENATANVRILTRTPAAALEPAVAPQISLTLIGRHSRPYPPGQVRVNGAHFYNLPSVFPDPVITWVHRNKVTQGDQMLHQNSSNVTPPVGLTYTIEVRRQSDNALLRTTTGITGTTWTYTEVLWAADGKPANIIFVLRSVDVDLNTSWQQYSIPVTIVDDGFGTSWGNDWGQH